MSDESTTQPQTLGVSGTPEVFTQRRVIKAVKKKHPQGNVQASSRVLSSLATTSVVPNVSTQLNLPSGVYFKAGTTFLNSSAVPKKDSTTKTSLPVAIPPKINVVTTTNSSATETITKKSEPVPSVCSIYSGTTLPKTNPVPYEFSTSPPFLKPSTLSSSILTTQATHNYARPAADLLRKRRCFSCPEKDKTIHKIVYHNRELKKRSDYLEKSYRELLMKHKSLQKKYNQKLKICQLQHSSCKPPILSLSKYIDLF